MSPTNGLHAPVFFFFNDTATTEIYTLSLHDALPISAAAMQRLHTELVPQEPAGDGELPALGALARSEEHTSELQSRLHLVCRLLLEKKKNTTHTLTCLPSTQHTDTRRLYTMIYL